MKLFEYVEHIGDWRVLIQTRDIRDAAITTRLIADGAVTEGKIGDGAVTGPKIGAGEVKERHIASDEIKERHIAPEQIKERHIDDDQIKERHIDEKQIKERHIADGQIESRHIADGAVKHKNLAEGAVQAGNIGEGAVLNENLTEGCVLAGNLSGVDDPNGPAVTSDKISGVNDPEGPAVTEEKIATAAVTTDKLSGSKDPVTGEWTTPPAVGNEQLAPGAVSSDKLAPGLIEELQTIMDATPTPDSEKPVNSGGVFNTIGNPEYYINKSAITEAYEKGLLDFYIDKSLYDLTGISVWNYAGYLRINAVGNNVDNISATKNLSTAENYVVYDIMYNNVAVGYYIFKDKAKFADNSSGSVDSRMSVPYVTALHAHPYAKLIKNIVGTENIKDGAVTSGKIAAESVGTGNIADAAVTGGKIAGGVVDRSKLSSGVNNELDSLEGSMASVLPELHEDTGAIGDITVHEKSVNLFDKSAVVDGVINRNNGQVQSSDLAVTTAMIPCEYGKTYCCPDILTGGSINGIAFFDENGDWVGYETHTTFNVSNASVKYFRYSILKENLDTSMLVEGTASDIPSEYVKYGNIYSIAIPDNSIDTDNIKNGSVGKTKLDNAVNADLDMVENLANSCFEWINLFDKSTATSGKAIDKGTGFRFDSNNYAASDYIAIPAGASTITISPYTVGGAVGWAVYNANKVKQRGDNTTTIAVSSGDAYIRISVNLATIDSAMAVVGNSLPAVYYPYGYNLKDGSVSSTKVAEKAVAPNKTTFIGMYSYPNKCNPNDPDFKLNYQITYSNGLEYEWTGSNVGRVGCTGFIPVSEKGLVLNHYGTIGNTSGMAVYNANKGYIRGDRTGTYTYQAGDAYVRFTFAYAYRNEIQVEEGTASSNYVPYHESYSIDPGLLPKEYVSPITLQKVGAFSGFRNKGSLAAGETLHTPDLRITKDTLLVGIINGSIENVAIGYHGNNTYARYLVVTPTKISIYTGTSTLERDYTHGLTLGTRTTVILDKDITGQANLKLISDLGGAYAVQINWGIYIGQPFITNNNSSAAVDAELTFMPKDIACKTWLFGDSYMGSYTATTRWPKWLIDWGFTAWLLNAMPGEDASQAIGEFENLLASGAKPKYVVWGYGMNNGSDSNGAVNSTWLAVEQRFIGMCEANGIIPILCTIPTVPTAPHEKLNEWVRSSSYRYIEFAKAVEADGDTHWKGWGTDDALLSSDGVHPTEKGALVLATAVLCDFPEIAVPNT